MLPASTQHAHRLFHELAPVACQFNVTGSFRFGKEPQKAKDLDFIVYGIGTGRPARWPGLTEWDYGFDDDNGYNYDNGYKATVVVGPYIGLCINIVTFDDWELYLDWKNAAEALECITPFQRPAGKDARVKMHEALLADYLEQRTA